MTTKRKFLSKAIRRRVYEKYGGKCAYCGHPIAYKDMQVDHLVALNAGGVDAEENYMPACRTCNHYKSTMTVDKFRAEIGLLTKRLNERVFIYKLARRHGRVEEVDTPVIFYFERSEEA